MINRKMKSPMNPDSWVMIRPIPLQLYLHVTKREESRTSANQPSQSPTAGSAINRDDSNGSQSSNCDEKCVRQKELLSTCMDSQSNKNKSMGSINYHLQRLSRGRK
ncbi:hypothetical protein ACLB2K_021883 [Fragaria x ananassa]